MSKRFVIGSILLQIGLRSAHGYCRDENGLFIPTANSKVDIALRSGILSTKGECNVMS
jgi:hypothetical protein